MEDLEASRESEGELEGEDDPDEGAESLSLS